MSNLGKLWFELGIKDKTDKDIAEIRKNVEKRLKALGGPYANSKVPDNGRCPPEQACQNRHRCHRHHPAARTFPVVPERTAPRQNHRKPPWRRRQTIKMESIRTFS